MAELCETFHRFVHGFPRHRFSFESLPANGVYLIFEEGELAHGGDRIVRVGTHTGQNNLPSRLSEHFIKANKDRSIFRKNIGRCFLSRDTDAYLAVWNQCMTARKDRARFGHLVNAAKQQGIEASITAYVQQSLSFSVLEIAGVAERLSLEKKLIATVARCSSCGPSSAWLGQSSPEEKVRRSGLWQVQHTSGQILTEAEVQALIAKMKTSRDRRGPVQNR